MKGATTDAEVRLTHNPTALPRPFSEGEQITMSQGLNVLALVKDSERFVFLYDDQSSASVLQTLGKYADDRDLAFTWYDAAVLSQRVRHLREKSETERSHNRLPESLY